MSINWSNWVLAESAFVRAGGRRALGGYCLRLSVRFDANPWREPSPPPVVTLAPSAITIDKPLSMFVGFALSDSVSPFQLSQYPQRSTVTFDVLLAPAAIFEIEAARHGTGVELTLRLNGYITGSPAGMRADDSIHMEINQTDWLRVLNECQYGRSLLFEVPIDPEAIPAAEQVASALEDARQHLSSGRYQEVVAACRLAIEQLNNCLGHGSALAAARSAKGEAKRALDIFERELLIRGAVFDFASLAHHSDHEQSRPFDRLDASLLLGITASLVCTALRRAGGR